MHATLSNAFALGDLKLANPDLVQRYRGGLPMNKVDHSTFYGGDEIVYTDCPTASHALESGLCGTLAAREP